MSLKYPMQYCYLGAQSGDDGGAFIVPFETAQLHVIASTGLGWDHVSVSLKNRCPNWREMSYIKDLFFEENDVVMQLHVAKKDHINFHNHCLHLWRPQNETIPLPPLECV